MEVVARLSVHKDSLPFTDSVASGREELVQGTIMGEITGRITDYKKHI